MTVLGAGGLGTGITYAWVDGDAGRLPQRVMDLSPYTLTPQLPMESFAGGPVLGIAAAAAALVRFGLLGFRRRDVLPE